MTLARVAAALVPTAAVGASLVACTLTRPLDYLTSGAADAAAPSDGSGDGGASNGGPDGEAPATPVADAQFGPRNLAQDAENLYWSNADGAIMTAPKQGGAARKIAGVPPPATITWIAADSGPGGDLFVIAADAVQRVPKAGGELVLVEKDAPKPRALAVDADAIFVAHSDLDSDAAAFLARYARDGTNRATLSVDGDDPLTVALHGDSVFWAGSTLDYGAVFELPKNAPAGSGATAKVYRGPSQNDSVYPDLAEAFAVDDEAIYFIEIDVAYRLPRTQEAKASILFEPPEGTNPVAFAFDGKDLYIADRRENGAIVRVAKTGGPPIAVATGQAVPTAIVADATSVYFTVQGTGLAPDGAVLRIAK